MPSDDSLGNSEAEWMLNEKLWMKEEHTHKGLGNWKKYMASKFNKYSHQKVRLNR